MVRIVKTEFYKLKRYHILWAGVALMLLSVLLTLFTSMANDGSVWDFAYLTEQVIKNNMSMIFPMCISLIAGYMISREQTDDTLKNILTVPISFKKLLTGKLIVCGVLSIFFGLICSLFTIIAEMIVGFPGFEISLAEVVDKGLEKVQEKNNVGQKLHKTPPFIDGWRFVPQCAPYDKGLLSTAEMKRLRMYRRENPPAVQL